MAYIIGSEDVVEPLSPYAGIHPVIRERAKVYVAEHAATPAEAIAHEWREQVAWEERIMAHPQNDPAVLAYCDSWYAWVQRFADDGDDDYADMTRSVVRGMIYKVLRGRGRDAQDYLGGITGVFSGVFRTLPNGELEEAE
jgi:hypothetical protein